MELISVLDSDEDDLSVWDDDVDDDTLLSGAEQLLDL